MRIRRPLPLKRWLMGTRTIQLSFGRFSPVHVVGSTSMSTIRSSLRCYEISARHWGDWGSRWRACITNEIWWGSRYCGRRSSCHPGRHIVSSDLDWAYIWKFWTDCIHLLNALWTPRIGRVFSMGLLHKAVLPRFCCHPPFKMAPILIGPVTSMVSERYSWRARPTTVAWTPLQKQILEHTWRKSTFFLSKSRLSLQEIIPGEREHKQLPFLSLPHPRASCVALILSHPQCLDYYTIQPAMWSMSYKRADTIIAHYLIFCRTVIRFKCLKLNKCASPLS